MDTDLFNEFLASSDTLRVYDGNQLVFSSRKERLLPLLEYLDHFALQHQKVAIFDKIMGNAAALLSIKADCQEIYSPLGSRLATRTLTRYSIKYHLSEIVPYIQNASGEDMCPMEKLSIDKAPEEFYDLMKSIIREETVG